MLKISCLINLDQQISVTAFFISSLATLKETLTDKTLAFHPKHPEQYQHLPFVPLKETMSLSHSLGTYSDPIISRHFMPFLDL